MLGFLMCAQLKSIMNRDAIFSTIVFILIIVTYDFIISKMPESKYNFHAEEVMGDTGKKTILHRFTWP